MGYLACSFPPILRTLSYLPRDQFDERLLQVSVKNGSPSCPQPEVSCPAERRLFGREFFGSRA